MNEPSKVTRREFIKTTAGGALALGAAQAGWTREIGPNDRVNVGVIGVGGMGYFHCDELVNRRKDKADIEIIGVCDVYEKRKKAATEKTGAKAYHDHRELLARPDLDAVVIASPDHWHAPMAIDAMRAGKDVYLQKPMTLTFSEAKEVVRVARETKRIVQIGAQGSSDDLNWQARKAIQDGHIGKVVWSQATYCRNSREGEFNWPIDKDASPKNIDWTRWLGHAPKVPWNPDRFFNFRKYWDYSGGIVTDLLYHSLTELSTALGREFPWRVVSTGGIWLQKDGREIPDTVMVSVDYPTEHSVNMPICMANEQGVPKMIRGHTGTIHFGDGHIRIVGDGPFRDEFKAKHGQDEMRVNSQPREDHMSNFLRCVRSRDASQLHLPVEDGYRIMTAIYMAVLSYRLNKMLFFDSAREAIVDSPPVASAPIRDPRGLRR